MTVSTTPLARRMLRTRLPSASVTYSTAPPCESARPTGPLRLTPAVPTPLLPPAAPLPAKVVTMAVGRAIARMR